LCEDYHCDLAVAANGSPADASDASDSLALRCLLSVSESWRAACGEPGVCCACAASGGLGGGAAASFLCEDTRDWACSLRGVKDAATGVFVVSAVLLSALVTICAFHTRCSRIFSVPPPEETDRHKREAPCPVRTSEDGEDAAADGGEGGGSEVLCACGVQLPPGANFCMKCGRQASIQVTCTCGLQMEVGANFCPSCGSQSPGAEAGSAGRSGCGGCFASFCGAGGSQSRPPPVANPGLEAVSPSASPLPSAPSSPSPRRAPTNKSLRSEAASPTARAPTAPAQTAAAAVAASSVHEVADEGSTMPVQTTRETKQLPDQAARRAQLMADGQGLSGSVCSPNSGRTSSSPEGKWKEHDLEVARPV